MKTDSTKVRKNGFSEELYSIALKIICEAFVVQDAIIMGHRSESEVMDAISKIRQLARSLMIPAATRPSRIEHMGGLVDYISRLEGGESLPPSELDVTLAVTEVAATILRKHIQKSAGARLACLRVSTGGMHGLDTTAA